MSRSSWLRGQDNREIGVLREFLDLDFDVIEVVSLVLVAEEWLADDDLV